MTNERAPGRRRRIALLGSAAAAMLISIAVPGLIGGPGPSPSPSRPAGGDPTGRPSDDAAIPPVDPGAWEDVRWLQVDDSRGVLGGPLGQYLTRVVVGGPGFVAVGSDAHGQPGAESSFGAIWVSADGTAWRETELNAGIGRGDVASITTVAAGPRGIVLWGGVCCGVEQAATWWSADGLGWERAPLPADWGIDSSVSDVEAGPDGFVAVGSSGRRMAIWTSPDGRAWSPVDADRLGLGAGLLTAVSRDDRGWITVGQADRPTHDGVVWRSDDLARWQPLGVDSILAGPEEVELAEIVPFAGGYLLTGNLGTHEDRARCEQLVGLAEGEMAASGRLALICGWGVATHWWSADGDRWELLPPIAEQPGGPPLPVRPDGRGLLERGVIRAGGPGLVTIGYEIAGRNAPNDVRALWVSPDGRSWAPVGRAPQFAPGASVSDLAVDGRSIVAVGSTWTEGAPNGEDGAVWIGTILP